ncbi:MAG: PorT family protein [Taibaiella sp.]|nr:PorT family protein [Taibaiella sp.]
MKMRTSLKAILCVLCLLPFAKEVQAQENYYVEEQRTFYGGIVAGVNFTQIDGDDFKGYDKIGANFGGKVYAQLDAHLAASMEILYSQKGSRSIHPQEAEPGVVITDYRVDLNYAEVPILLNYFDKRKSHFGGGFSYSQLAGSAERITTTPASATSGINFENYPFKKVDINIVLAGDLHLYKGLFLDVRFQYSLFPIRTSVPTKFSRGEQFSNMWVVRLMYLFK